jgi:hypothetical protein
MNSVMEGQKKAMASTVRQSAAQGLARLKLNLSEEDKAAYIEMQNATMNEAIRVVKGPEMRSAMARIYSDI